MEKTAEGQFLSILTREFPIYHQFANIHRELTAIRNPINVTPLMREALRAKLTRLNASSGYMAGTELKMFDNINQYFKGQVIDEGIALIILSKKLFKTGLDLNPLMIFSYMRIILKRINYSKDPKDLPVEFYNNIRETLFTQKCSYSNVEDYIHHTISCWNVYIYGYRAKTNDDINVVTWMVEMQINQVFKETGFQFFQAIKVIGEFTKLEITNFLDLNVSEIIIKYITNLMLENYDIVTPYIMIDFLFEIFIQKKRYPTKSENITETLPNSYQIRIISDLFSLVLERIDYRHNSSIKSDNNSRKLRKNGGRINMRPIDKYTTPLESIELEHDEFTFDDLFFKNNIYWIQFYIWFSETKTKIKQYNGNILYYSERHYRNFLNYYNIIDRLISDTIIKIQSERLTAAQLCLYNVNRLIFINCFKSDVRDALSNQIESSFNQASIYINRFNEIMTVIDHFVLANDSSLQGIISISNIWDSLTASEMAQLFNENSLVINGQNYETLSLDLTECFKLLFYLRESKFFTKIFFNLKSDEKINLIGRVILALEEWRKLYFNIVEGNISTFQLIGMNNLELEILLSTFDCYKNESRIRFVIHQIDKNDSYFIELEKKISIAIHIAQLYENIDSVLLSLENNYEIVKSSVTKSYFKNLIESTLLLKAKFEAVDKESIELASIDDFFEANLIDPCFIQLGGEFFQLLRNYSKLIEWLQALRSDIDFTSSVEIAMGKSEMECPDELWVNGQPGRPDEEKLSMLSNTRAYLHSFLYYEKEYEEKNENESYNQDDEDMEENYFDYLKRLQSLGAIDQQILEGIRVCGEHADPLMELVGNDGESAPDRLVQMFLPIKATNWFCSNQILIDENIDTSNGDGKKDISLWLEWTVWRKGIEVKKRHYLSGLLDFQSSVVLAKTDNRSAETQNYIDKFINQFSWLREIRKILIQLFEAGHFDYQEFTFQYSIQGEVAEIRSRVILLQNQLNEWNENSALLHQRFYLLNYFTMKRIYEAISFLRNWFSPPNSNFKADKNASGKIFSDLLSLINIDDAFNYKKLDKMVRLFKNHWKEFSSNPNINFETISSTSYLLLFGILLTVIHYGTKINLSSYTLDQMTDDLIIKKNTKKFFNTRYLPYTIFKYISYREEKVKVITISDQVYQGIVAFYSSYQHKPEQFQILFCNNKTSEEELNNLLNRWAYYHTFFDFDPPKHLLFSLVRVDKLPFELQRKLVLKVRELMGIAVHILAIFSNDDKNHVYIQLQQYDNFFSMHVAGYQTEVYKKLNYLNHVKVFESKLHGAGKSFYIRLFADKNGYQYVHIPVYRYNAKFISHLKKMIRNYNSNEKILLHIDVSPSVTPEFEQFLIQICFFGTIQYEQEYFCLNPLCFIAIEFSNESPFIKSRDVLPLLPKETILLEDKSFCSSKKDLLAGMKEEFDSPKNDGTCYRKEYDISDVSNAYERLQYVCTILKVLYENNSRFPFIFKEPNQTPLEALRLSQSNDFTVNQNDINGEECFNLILDAIKLKEEVRSREKTISLHSIWSFINIMYCSLKNLNEDSPVNLDCKRNGQTNAQMQINKERLKGLVIKFICKSASEIGIGKLPEYEREYRLVMSGFYLFCEWNEEWKYAFESDGNVCYVSKNYYLYFNSAQNRWEISKALDFSLPVEAYSNTSSLSGEWWAQGYIGAAPSELRMQFHQYGNGNNALESSQIIPKKPQHGIFMQLEWNSEIPMPKKLSITEQDLGKYNYYCARYWEKKIPTRYIIYDPVNQCYRLTSSTKFEPKSIKATLPANNLVSNERWKIEYPEGTYSITAVENKNNRFIYSPSDYIKWGKTNHEILLFTSDPQQKKTIRVLAVDKDKLTKNIHPLFNSFLENIVSDAKSMTQSECFEILSSITGISFTEEEGSQLLGSSYVFTGDNLLKILSIYTRLQCGMPIVLMGECGCGKTMLIRFLCTWLGVKLLILDVHGGTTENDFMKIFKQADDMITSGEEREVFVFLDEVNACAHMDLISMAITKRVIYGDRINERVQILAALNPYRKRKQKNGGQKAGLAFHYGNSEIEIKQDAMSDLVYRVYPPPESLRDFIFDFGSIDSTKELQYIRTMVQSRLSVLIDDNILKGKAIVNCILECQSQVRTIEQDDSATSLRDVKRTLDLILWFGKIIPKNSKRFPPLITSTLLSLAFVYVYRLNQESDRKQIWNSVAKILALYGKFEDFKSDCENINQIISRFQMVLCSKISVEEGISFNQALLENIFVMVICILNKLPIFVVGKPGSSKTLSLQVIASNLQGKQSSNKFWRRFPAIYVVQYQCSPLSDSHSIRHQYEMAVRYQQHAKNVITVLLLDEVGLAELSPDMPLKVLHEILVDPPISIVGLSNWVLDAAKMNRAICLQRTDPSPEDIADTGKGIIIGENSMNNSNSDLSQFSKWLPAMARGYHAIYSTQRGRDFIGMRDYYHLLKLLRRFLIKTKGLLTPDILSFIVQRNFGGNEELLKNVLASFNKQCFGNIPVVLKPVIQFVRSNLVDPSARHLMLLTHNSCALRILFNANLLNGHSVKVLTGSEFSEDKSELYLINQINEVKLAMATGSTIVLLNHDNIYEALYDVLNQRYLYKVDSKTKKVKKMLRLAIGSRSQLCQVQNQFKIVVIVEKEHALENLSFPLLNRFEKQIFTYNDVLGPNQKTLSGQLIEWLHKIKDELQFYTLDRIICGYHEETIPSAVLAYSQYDDNQTEGGLENIQNWLYDIMFPVAVITKKESQNSRLFHIRSNLASFFKNYLNNPQQDPNPNIVLMTFSPVIHYYQFLEENHLSRLNFSEINFQLGEITSEFSLRRIIWKFFKSNDEENENEDTKSVLTILCDPLVCNQAMINQALIVVQQVRSSWEHKIKMESRVKKNLRNSVSIGFDENTTHKSVDDAEDILFVKNKLQKKIIVFMVLLTPSVKSRERKYFVDIYNPWKFLFIDDLRSLSSENSIQRMCELPIHQILNEDGDLTTIIKQVLKSVVIACYAPETKSDKADVTLRVFDMENMMRKGNFLNFIQEMIMIMLEKHTRDPSGLLYQLVILKRILFGSLYSSLKASITVVISQILAGIMHIIDRNFNLYTFQKSPEIWLRLAQNPAVLTPELISSVTRIGGTTIIPEMIFNYGVDGPMEARFPFSFSIMRFINSDESRNVHIVLMNLDENKNDKINWQENIAKAIGKLGSIISNIYGEDLIQLCNGTYKYYNDYLADYVAMIYPLYPNLSLASKISIYKSLLDCYYPPWNKSIAAIHYCIWELEENLFHICSLISSSSDELNQMIVTTIRKRQANLKKNQLEQYNGNIALYFFIIDILRAVVDYFWKLLSINNLQNGVKRFQRELINSKYKISTLFAIVSNFRSNCENEIAFNLLSEQSQQIQKSLSALHMIYIFNQEYSSKSNAQFEYYPALLLITQVHQPSTAIYFSKVINIICKSIVVGELVISSFLLRYFGEIVFSNSNTKLDEDLSNLIIKIINYDADLLENIYIQSIPKLFWMNSLTLRRLLFQMIQEYPSLLSSTFAIKSISAAQLYLQYQMDNLSENSNALDIDIVNEKDQILYVCKTNISTIFSTPEIFTYLQYLAKIMVFIQIATKKYYDEIYNGVMNALPPTLIEIMKFDREIFLYIFKSFLQVGGYDLLADFLIQRELHNWIPILNSNIVPRLESRSIYDPFVLINTLKVGEYQKFQVAVKDILERKEQMKLNELIHSKAPDLKENDHTKKLYNMGDDYFRRDLFLASVVRAAFHNLDLHSITETDSTIKDLQVSKVLQWIIGGFKFSTREKNGKILNQLKLEQKIHLQLMSHCILWATAQKNTFWNTLLFDTSKLDAFYLPGMPTDDISSFSQVLSGLGWYRCPNGHPYTVGECTRPMVESYCIQCNAQIGGRNHISSAGNVRIQPMESVPLPNYTLSTPNEILSSKNVSEAASFLLRYFLHCILLLAPVLSPNLKKFIDKFTASNKQGIGKSMMSNFEALKRLLGFSTSEVAAFIHSILGELPTAFSTPRSFVTHPEAESYNIHFSEWLNRNYLSDSNVLHSKLNQIQLAINLNSIDILKSSLGGKLFYQLTEVIDKNYSFEYENNFNDQELNVTNEQLIWRLRTTSSFAQFEHQFQINSNNRSRYQILDQFLREESKLHCVKYIIDILQWQSLLFSIFPANSITRQQASDITNEEAILKLAIENQENAFEIFSKFAFAFNSSFNLVENLFECQKNPFISLDYKVDLSGTKKENREMSLTIPIIFSLPTVVQSDFDLRGLCTIKLLNVLQATHSSILEKFLAQIGVHKNNNNNNNNNMIGVDEVVPITIHTSRLVLESHLIAYDRKTHLLPLINKYQVQSLNYGEGKSIIFQYDLIENEIKEKYLVGKKQITMVIQPFFFKGDFIQRSPLSALCKKIPQVTLSQKLKEQICTELDTIERVNNLLNLLELITNFLISISLSVNDSSILLSKYAIDVVKLDENNWNEISSSSIDKSVNLSHIQSLFVTLEEQTKQSPIDNVVMKYRVPLNNKSEWEKIAQKLDLNILLPILREFLTTQLTTDNWSAEASLKEYLTYVESGEALEDHYWFTTHFPDISLQFAYHLYLFLSNF